MTTKNNIPAGYKDSAVGVIPQEWEVKRLGTIAKCFSGGTPKSESEGMYGGTIPFIRSGEIHGDKTALYLTDDGLRKSSAKMVDVGDLIFALYGANSGDCAISQINGAINQAILCIRSSSVINSFLQPYLELQKDRFIAKYLQGGQGNLSGEIVSSYTIPVPPIAEQRKIAEILGVWDEAIEKQSRLIEKLELRKRALMQRLLTGRTRLSGFTTPWQKFSYSEVLKEVKRKMNWDDNEEYDLISVKRRSGGLFHRESLFGRDIKTKNLRPTLKGDFLISKMQIVHGASGLVTEEFDGMKISGSYIALIAKDDKLVDMSFINWYSKTPYFYHQTYVSSYGVHIEKMTFDLESFMSMSIWLPDLPEQEAIAEVLTAADNEIATHRKKLDAIRLQKRGLMQQLLTGKTRVKI